MLHWVDIKTYPSYVSLRTFLLISYGDAGRMLLYCLGKVFKSLQRESKPEKTSAYFSACVYAQLTNTAQLCIEVFFSSCKST